MKLPTFITIKPFMFNMATCCSINQRTLLIGHYNTVYVSIKDTAGGENSGDICDNGITVYRLLLTVIVILCRYKNSYGLC